MVFHWKTDTISAIFTDSLGVATTDTLKDTIWVVWPKLSFSKQHILTVQGELNGCHTKIDSLIVYIRPGINNDFYNLGGNVAICKGDNHIFSVSSILDTVLWQDSSTLSSYTAYNAQKVWVRVANSFGCTASDTSIVTVNPLPYVNLGNDTTLCFGNTLTLDAGYYMGASYIWYNNSLTNIVGSSEKFAATINDSLVWVVVTDTNNCSSSDTIKIFTCFFDADQIPTAFTPGRPTNNYWVIKNIEAYPDASVKIFDRWGRLMYHSSNLSPWAWDGRTKNGYVAMDAYFYILNLNTKGAKPITGSVTVIR